MFTPLLLAAALVVDADCSLTLSRLATKVVANYAGYHLEVVGARRVAYDSMLRALQPRAASAAVDQCLPVLRSYIAWFNDPHLAIIESTNIDSAETRRRSGSIRTIALTEAEVLRGLRARSTIDPIEGIWYDGSMRLAIVPDPDAARGTFAAVVVASDTITLPIGAVRGTFTRQPDSTYAWTLHTRKLARQSGTATIHRRSMLRLSPGMWGKTAPLAPADTGWLDPADVHRATLRAWDDVVVISIPSHDYAFKAHFDSLLTANRSTLASARRLIVDLRGNEGGGSQMIARLHPYLVGDSLRRDGFDQTEAVMWSSPDQIAYARRAFGADTSAFVRRLVAALEAAPGTLVPMYDSSVPAPMPRPIIPIYGPRRVGVLIDGGTVSASEVTVQLAKRSGRAIVYGERTAGALDYQSTSFTRLSPDENRWLLLYPTITASAKLPAGGMRGVGIAPDVSVRWSMIGDPIAHIAELLRAKNE